MKSAIYLAFKKDVEAKATNMYNPKLRHGGQILKVTLHTQAQTKLQGGGGGNNAPASGVA